jgi:hypothetical protein
MVREKGRGRERESAWCVSVFVILRPPQRETPFYFLFFYRGTEKRRAAKGRGAAPGKSGGAIDAPNGSTSACALSLPPPAPRLALLIYNFPPAREKSAPFAVSRLPQHFPRRVFRIACFALRERLTHGKICQICPCGRTNLDGESGIIDQASPSRPSSDDERISSSPASGLDRA